MSLPAYAHRFSPKLFTQHQLFACLALKAFFKTDYRGITAILSDMPDLRRTLGMRRVTITTLVADAGYESESNHVYCREYLGIESIIPTTERGRPRTDGQPRPTTGYYRRQMAAWFNKAKYGQRWQVETVFSMIKRNLGSALSGRTYWAQCRDMLLLALTHNIMIIKHRMKLFYRATH